MTLIGFVVKEEKLGERARARERGMITGEDYAVKLQEEDDLKSTAITAYDEAWHKEYLVKTELR